MADTPRPRSRDTALVRGGLRRSPHGETAEALYLTSGFVYDSPEAAEARFSGDQPGFVYSRYANPTVEMFERRLAEIEGAEACHGTASGMAAVFAALASWLQAGDHVVAARALFGSCLYIVNTLLPRYGIQTTLVDGADLDQWRAAMRPNTKAVFFETPANPTLALVDIAAVAEIAHAHGAQVIVDNVFATPLLQRPLLLGADIVVYSATKHIDGQGRCLGGAILGTAEWCENSLKPFLRHTGPALSPFNAWVLVKGLETMALRVERASRTALAVAQRLEGAPGIARTLYPGLASFPQYALAQRQMSGASTLVAFELAGGKAAAFAFLNALEVIDISNNLGDAKSLITHPATTTHRSVAEADRLAQGITDGLLRLSVGIEGAEDLLADLERGIAAAAAVAADAGERAA